MQFSPDGKHIAAGLINGQVFFYDFENLKYVTQLNCRNRSGQYAAGSKVISFFNFDVLLVLSNLSKMSFDLIEVTEIGNIATVPSELFESWKHQFRLAINCSV